MSSRLQASVVFLCLSALVACSSSKDDEVTSPRPTGTPSAERTPTPSSGKMPTPPSHEGGQPTPTHLSPTATPIRSHADVVGVETGGTAGDYTFSVSLLSLDTGCEHYADWWEVLAEDGTLIYRRILNHSHPDEQPFIRSGGPVTVEAAQKVIVRGHMNTSGYGGQAMSGSVDAGFAQDSGVPATFASEVESQPPLPSGCAF